jgi:hypothetical protein
MYGEMSRPFFLLYIDVRMPRPSVQQRRCGTPPRGRRRYCTVVPETGLPSRTHCTFFVHAFPNLQWRLLVNNQSLTGGFHHGITNYGTVFRKASCNNSELVRIPFPNVSSDRDIPSLIYRPCLALLASLTRRWSARVNYRQPRKPWAFPTRPISEIVM